MLPKPGIYQHYKGKLYQVIGISRHSETLDVFVVYQQLYADFGLWVRPAEMFLETVTINGESVPRFKFINEHLAKAPTVK